MSINEEGYLSNEVVEMEKRIINRSSKYFELANEINVFAHALKFNLTIQKNDIQQIITSGLFISNLEGFNSLYILLSKGLLSDARIILRSILERTIKLKYVAMEYSNAITYSQQTEFDRLDLMKYILKNRDTFSEEINSEVTVEKVNELTNELKEKSYQKLENLSQLAVITNMTVYYRLIYKQLNKDVHSDLNSLHRLFEKDESGEILTMKWNSYFSDTQTEIEMTLFTTCGLIITTIEEINKLFNISESGLESIIIGFTEIQNYIKSSLD